MGAQRSRPRRKRRIFISAGTTDTRPNERLTPRSGSKRISRSSQGASGMASRLHGFWSKTTAPLS